MQTKFRLKKNYDFQRIINSKKKLYNNTFVIYYEKNDLSHLRLGISVSKKITNAVNRNRIRRQIRSMLQKYTTTNNSKDIIVLVRKSYLEQEFKKNQESLNSLLQRII